MWPILEFPEDLVTFTEEILNGKLHFLCSVYCSVFCHFPTPSFLHSYNVHLKMIISFVLAYFECATAFIHSQFELKYVLQRYNYFCLFNPFVSNAPFLHPLKTSEKLTIFWCSQGVEKGCIGNKWVNFFRVNPGILKFLIIRNFHNFWVRFTL